MLSLIDTESFAKGVQGKILLCEPLRNHTTIKVGGPCDIWFEPIDINDCQKAVFWANENNVPWIVVGRGANLLVKDGGFLGLVIHLKNESFQSIERVDTKVKVDAGVSLAKLLKWTVREGLSGLEFMSGIPGTVGGALRMNAGAFGGQISDPLIQIKLMTKQGDIKTVSKEECQFEYRDCHYLKNAIVLGAEFDLISSHSESVQKEISRIESIRKTKYPSSPNVGCCFKNISDDVFAGKLIDELGLKRKTVGGAMISEEHANFIINNGDATTKDILDLMSQIRQIVKTETSYDLEHEAVIIGNDK